MNGEKNRAFALLYHSTCDQILKYAVSKCGNIDDASDIMQKTYLNYYESVQTRGNMVENPLHYLYKIANHELSKLYTSNSISKNNIPAFSEIADGENFEAMEALLVQELPEDAKLDTQEIWQYIKTLDPLTVKIFVLYFYHDETWASIAKILNINESRAKSRLYRTVEKLKEKFNLT
ncbi:MAG: sigma-70 family RNA polymerase sigma factor [Oscillospiraceae bacterium]|nr:sigma-70 family RNA polymerase sigma factor [Oscillospiraceae bacterium]